MTSHSLIAILVLSILYNVVLCVPQVALTKPPTFLPSAAPDNQGQASAAPSCGGCYLVADVAGLIWYSEVFLNTAATKVISVGVSNGSRATRTSFVLNEGEFTFNLAGMPSMGGALTQINFQPTVDVGGALLTSPTPYNVFTAYSVTSAYSSNGICVMSSGPAITLPTGYSQPLPSASGKVYLDAAGQQQFIDFLGFSTCSAGGENVVATALIQVTNTTHTTTLTYSSVPLAAISARLTIAPKSTPSSASPGSITTLTNVLSTTSTPSSATTAVFPSVAAPIIVLGSSTVTPTANPINLPLFNSTVVGTAGTTGAGGGNSTGGVVQFVSNATISRGTDARWAIWVAIAVGLGGFVYYL